MTLIIELLMGMISKTIKFEFQIIGTAMILLATTTVGCFIIVKALSSS